MRQHAGEESLGRLMARTLAADRRALLHVALLTAVAQLLLLPLPLLSRAAIDRAMGDHAPSTLTSIVIAVAALAVFDAIASWCRGRATLAVEARLELGVARSLLDRVIRMPFRMLLAKTSGEVMQSFDGVTVARELLGSRAAGAVFDAVTVLSFLALMLVVAPRGALFVGSCAMTAGGVSIGFAYVQRAFQQRETAASVAQRNAVLELLRGISRVKAAAAESRFVARWRARLDAQIAASVRRQRAAVWPDVVTTLIRDSAAAAILIGFAPLIGGPAGETANASSVGAVVALLQMAMIVLGATGRLAEVCGSVIAIGPQLEAAREVLALPIAARPGARARVRAARVVVDDVTFRYRADLPDVLRNVSLTVEDGAIRRVDGPSGSGKSTLLRLVAGIIDPDRGSVRVSGDILYIPQCARLVSGTLAENLALLSAGAPLPRIQAAAHEIGLGGLLRTLPSGFRTMLQASGTGLSSGQRQLILLTAAAASERRVLVLDEPMANLDTAAQQRILASRAFSGKTIVYASHTAAW